MTGTGAVRPSPSAPDAAVPTAPQAHSARSSENVLGVAPQKGHESVWGDRARATRLLADAERSAQSITDEDDKASALVEVAKAMAATDPDHAARLLADTERIAQSITDENLKALAFVQIAKVWNQAEAGVQ